MKRGPMPTPPNSPLERSAENHETDTHDRRRRRGGGTYVTSMATSPHDFVRHYLDVLSEPVTVEDED